MMMDSTERGELKRIARKVPEIAAYSSAIFPESLIKNHWLRGPAECVARYISSVSQPQLPTGAPLHYFHDPRFTKFTPPGVEEFQTKFKSFRWGPVHLLFAWRVLTTWLYIELCMLPRNLTWRNQILHLTAFDLACLWVLCRHYQVRQIYNASHFQPYVFIISELRQAGIIDQHIGMQHGAWSLRHLGPVTADIPYDHYVLLDERFLVPFRKYIDRAGKVQVSIQTSAGGIQWKQREAPHIAIALQNDDYANDFEIARRCANVCRPLGIEVVIYVHPHPATTQAVIDSFQDYGTLITDRDRFGDSLCLVTRYSTLALEFAIHGGNAIFVDTGDSLVFDETGLDVCFTDLEGLEKALETAVENRSGLAELPQRSG